MLELHINNKIFEGFRSIQATKNMGGLCGHFTITFAGTSVISDITDRINVFDKITIYADSHKIMTAFVETINIDYTSDNYEISVCGREVTCDVVDCKVSAGFTQTGTTSLVTLISNLFAKEKLGEIGQSAPKSNPIKIIDKSDQGNDPFLFSDFLIASNGTSVYDFINTYAQKKFAILITNADGDIVIANSGVETLSYSLTNIPGERNNILKSNLAIDVSKLYRSYTYRSIPDYTNQVGSDASPESLSTVSATSESPDTNIREGRNYLNIQDDAYTIKKLQELVRWREQTNITNARVYTVTLAGHTFKNLAIGGASGVISLNDLIKIDDKMAGISDAFIVNGLTYLMSEDGNTLEIEFVNRYAYSLLDQETILKNAFYNPTS